MANHRKQIIGTIVSDRMNKTRVVEVERVKKHPRYLKRFKVSKKYKAHDENNEYKVGDKVLIQECRPMSKDKKWRIVEKIESRK
ncbi:MAG: 30S ribosomal protein S17 [bacterium]|nr:30S ribosomal protein S17 [bacterium]